MIENVYRLQIMNTTERARAFDIEVSRPARRSTSRASRIAGVPGADEPHGAGAARACRDAGRVAPGAHPIEFHVRALGTRRRRSARDVGLHRPVSA